MTTTTAEPTTTATPCPSWCTTDHTDMPPGAGFHASTTPAALPVVFRLWQTDHEGARAGVVIAGQLLSEAEAHEFGMALVRLGDVLRREAHQ